MDVVSFKENHDNMERGIYVSRKDTVGDSVITTFDIRMKVPNKEPVLGNSEIHTMEHLMAVYLRGNESNIADKVIYVGPMGCRTGFYIIFKGDLSSKDIIDVIKNTFSFVMNFNKEVPANTSRECGNYLEHNLTFAKYEAKKYYNEVLLNLKDINLSYQE